MNCVTKCMAKRGSLAKRNNLFGKKLFVTRSCLERMQKSMMETEKDAKKKSRAQSDHGFCKRIFLRYRGLLYAFIAGLSGSVAQITIRKASNISGSEHSIVRNAFQLLFLFAVIKYKNLDALGPKSSRGMLLFRAVIGGGSLLAWSFSVMLIPPSDVISLIYISIVITAVLSRFFMKEMLSFAHVISIILTLAGVFLIAQPEFIFGKSSSSSSEIIQSFINSTNQTLIEPSSNSRLSSVIGVSLALLTALFSGMAPVIIKHLIDKNVHYSVMTIYTSYFGLPASIVIDLILIYTGAHTKAIDLFRTNPAQLAIELLLSMLTAVLSLFNQVMFNISIEYDDPTKCTIIRSFEVFLTFIWQRIFLDIQSNFTSILGAVFIFLAALGVILFKELDKRYAPVHMREPESTSDQNTQRKVSRVRRCFFYRI